MLAAPICRHTCSGLGPNKTQATFDEDKVEALDEPWDMSLG